MRLKFGLWCVVWMGVWKSESRIGADARVPRLRIGAIQQRQLTPEELLEFDLVPHGRRVKDRDKGRVFVIAKL